MSCHLAVLICTVFHTTATLWWYVFCLSRTTAVLGLAAIQVPEQSPTDGPSLSVFRRRALVCLMNACYVCVVCVGVQHLVFLELCLEMFSSSSRLTAALRTSGVPPFGVDLTKYILLDLTQPRFLSVWVAARGLRLPGRFRKEQRFSGAEDDPPRRNDALSGTGPCIRNIWPLQEFGGPFVIARCGAPADGAGGSQKQSSGTQLSCV